MTQTKIAALVASAQMKIDGYRGNDVHGLAVHVSRFAAPGLDTGDGSVNERRLRTFDNFFDLNVGILSKPNLEPHAAFDAAFARGHRIRRARRVRQLLLKALGVLPNSAEQSEFELSNPA